MASDRDKTARSEPLEKGGWSPRQNGPKNPPKGPSTMPVWPRNHPNAPRAAQKG